MAQYYLEDKEFGYVMLGLRAGMCNIRAMWKQEKLHIHAPKSITVKDLRTFIDDNREQLRAMRKPARTYSFGQVITCFKGTITITTDDTITVPTRVYYNGDNQHNCENMRVALHPSVDITKFTRTITSVIEGLLDNASYFHIIPFARAEAALCGVQPADIVIGRGLRKLGHCTNKRVVQLSRNLMLLPEELVRLVVCHEFAHLTHFNHSPAFHALVDTYVGGREAELDHQLKHFSWPIIK